MDRAWVFEGNKIESIGDDQYMLPQNMLGFDTESFGPLRCYSDKSITYSTGELCTKLVPTTEWAPIRAKWYYNEPGADESFGNKNTFISLESKKDTVIKGRNCHAIDVKLNDSKLISQEFISQSKDSVFYYNPFYNSFFLLYNFSAKAGDTIVVHKNKFKPTKGFYSKRDSIANFKYKIVAVDTIEVGRNRIKRQKITSLLNADWGFQMFHPSTDQYIYNLAGSLTYFFGGESGITFPEIIPTILRCYSDNSLTYKSSEWNYPCNYITGTNEIEKENSIKLFPNPVINSIAIESNEEIMEIRVISAISNTISKYYPVLRKVDIDFSQFSNGLYVLQITTQNKTLNYKILKN